MYMSNLERESFLSKESLFFEKTSPFPFHGYNFVYCELYSKNIFKFYKNYVIYYYNLIR